MKLLLFLGGERMLQFEHIAKSYKTKQILRDINLTIQKVSLWQSLEKADVEKPLC